MNHPKKTGFYEISHDQALKLGVMYFDFIDKPMGSRHTTPVTQEAWIAGVNGSEICLAIADRKHGGGFDCLRGHSRKTSKALCRSFMADVVRAVFNDADAGAVSI